MKVAFTSSRSANGCSLLQNRRHSIARAAAASSNSNSWKPLCLQQCWHSTALFQVEQSCRREPNLQICRMTVPHQLGNSAEADVARPDAFDAAWAWFYAFFKFSRPHTVLGTFISIMSVSLLALVSLDDRLPASSLLHHQTNTAEARRRHCRI